MSFCHSHCQLLTGQSHCDACLSHSHRTAPCIAFLSNFLFFLLMAFLLSLFHRKHCVACKCPRETHDVTHLESVNVQDRLGLNKDTSQQQQTDQQLPASSARVMPLTRGRPTSSDVYSWIPAGISTERVSWLMKKFFVYLFLNQVFYLIFVTHQSLTCLACNRFVLFISWLC